MCVVECRGSSWLVHGITPVGCVGLLELLALKPGLVVANSTETSLCNSGLQSHFFALALSSEESFPCPDLITGDKFYQVL